MFFFPIAQTHIKTSSMASINYWENRVLSWCYNTCIYTHIGHRSQMQTHILQVLSRSWCQIVYPSYEQKANDTVTCIRCTYLILIIWITHLNFLICQLYGYYKHVYYTHSFMLYEHTLEEWHHSLLYLGNIHTHLSLFDVIPALGSLKTKPCVEGVYSTHTGYTLFRFMLNMIRRVWDSECQGKLLCSWPLHTAHIKFTHHIRHEMQNIICLLKAKDKDLLEKYFSLLVVGGKKETDAK